MNQHVWIVEMYNTEKNRWEPRASASLDKQDAKFDVSGWRVKNPDDKFRIAKYNRAMQ